MNQILRNCRSRIVVFIATLILPAAFCLNQSVYSQVGEYQDYKSFQSSLKSLVEANSDLAVLESIGKTNEGRDIWLVTIGNK